MNISLKSSLSAIQSGACYVTRAASKACTGAVDITSKAASVAVKFFSRVSQPVINAIKSNPKISAVVLAALVVGGIYKLANSFFAKPAKA